MKDERLVKLASNVVNYAVEIKPEEKVLIDCTGNCLELVKELINEIYKVGGYPFVKINNKQILREILMNCNKKQIEYMASYDIKRSMEADAYIFIQANENMSELSDVPEENMKMYMEYYSKAMRNTRGEKWSVLSYPTNLIAHMSNMSLEKFEEFYFSVCNLDYRKMSTAMDKLLDYMKNTNKIRIKGKDTDISLSIKNMLVEKSNGKRNIPDGEVYTGPVIDSVNGRITYNIPSTYNSVKFENVSLLFKNGKIVEAKSNKTEELNKILNIDEGARYVGEFAIGLNPYITKPMNSILFDEKMCGSIHLTPGNSLDKIDNKNRSSIHWDLVLAQTSEYGGGEIWFDNVLVRKDGLFVIDILKCLNPDNLI